jgi:hypothetical protein
MMGALIGVGLAYVVIRLRDVVTKRRKSTHKDV